MNLPASPSSVMSKSILPLHIQSSHLPETRCLGYPPTLAFWVKNKQFQLFLLQLEHIGTHQDTYIDQTSFKTNYVSKISHQLVLSTNSTCVVPGQILVVLQNPGTYILKCSSTATCYNLSLKYDLI